MGGLLRNPQNALWDRSRQETIGQFAVCSAFEELLECISKADNGQWAVSSVSPGLRFGPHFTPLCFSILDQLEKELSASRICPFCVKLLLQVFLRGKEAQRIAHFVGQRVSECIDTPANRADRNELVLVSYARLGAHIAPTDVLPDGCEKCGRQLRGDWFGHCRHPCRRSPPLLDLRPRKRRSYGRRWRNKLLLGSQGRLS